MMAVRRHPLKNNLFLIGALVLGIGLGLFALSTPSPASLDAPGFSARRAFVDIEALAKVPHTVWDQASLPPVRDYIRGRLAGMGLEPVTLKYPPITDAFGHEYPLENIAARIPGKSGRYLLLVAHYDSSPKKRTSEQAGSRGAADDGYGVSTMLEIARLLTTSKIPLENGVAFLFTDAEETGLYGARAEMTANLESWKDVDFVVNLEARGVKGPAVMFETGRNNRATIELYRAADFAFAYSFAVDVYRLMTNGTDFTAFIRAGYAGINFAVLDSLAYYHTPKDNPANVSLASLQHYGAQVLPIVMKYSGDPRYADPKAFVSPDDMTYFNWLPGVFVSYPAGFAGLLSAAIALCFLAWFALGLRKGRVRLGASLLWLLAWLGFALAALGLGLGTSVLLSKLTGIAFKITYMPGVPGSESIAWIFLAVELGIAWLFASRRLRARRDRDSMLAGALALNLCLLAVFHRFLPGGTFFLAIPVAVSLLGSALAAFAKKPWLALLGPVFALSLFVPILHLLDITLTTGALGIVLFLAALPASMAGPLLATSRGGEAATENPAEPEAQAVA